MSTAAVPAEIRILLQRGGEYARSGDTKAATSYFQAALRTAAQAGAVPPELAAELRQAQQYVQQRAADFQAAIEQAVHDSGVPSGPAGDRLRHALDMLNGKREIFHQQPSVFYFPYLAQRQFFEREEFDWVPAFEAETDAIRHELAGLIEEGAPFRPYVEAEKDRPRQDVFGLMDDPSWSALYLWRDGALVDEVAAKCPRTVAALERVPMSRIGSRTPSVLFSLLRPGAHIPPHHGMLNSRLICHLPLIVPPGCWLRVGNETREWQEGKLLVFDDSMSHEAKNPTDQTRVILLFDIWRPDLSEEERRGVSAIFDAIDRFTGLPDA